MQLLWQLKYYHFSTTVMVALQKMRGKGTNVSPVTNCGSLLFEWHGEAVLYLDMKGHWVTCSPGHVPEV